jgi:hypothetical protein
MRSLVTWKLASSGLKPKAQERLALIAEGPYRKPPPFERLIGDLAGACSRRMNVEQSNNPMHGVTLETVVVTLVEHYGWDELANKININCFKNDPSVKSSLKFLRKTPWAREQVEHLYLSTLALPSDPKNT